MNFTLENYCFVRNHKTKDCGTLVCFNDFFLIWYCPFITQLSPWNLLPSCHPRIYYPTPLPTPQVVFTTFSIWWHLIKPPFIHLLVVSPVHRSWGPWNSCGWGIWMDWGCPRSRPYRAATVTKIAVFSLCDSISWARKVKMRHCKR